MSLRIKIAAFLLIIFIAFMTSAYLFFSKQLQISIAQLENETMHEEMAQVKASLSDLEKNLLRQQSLWLRGKRLDDLFIENIDTEFLDALGAQWIGLWNEQGEIIASAQKQSRQPLQQLLREALLQMDGAIFSQGLSNPLSGLLSLSKTPFVVAAQTIEAGVLPRLVVWAFALPLDKINKSSSLIGVHAKIEALEDPILLEKLHDNTIWVQSPNANDLLAQAIYQDITKKDAFYLTLHQSRPLYVAVKKNIQLTRTIRMVTMMIVLMVIFILVDRMVLDKLNKINTFIVRVAQSEHSTELLTISSHDEIGALAELLNKLLEKLRYRFSQIELANEKIVHQSEALNELLSQHTIAVQSARLGIWIWDLLSNELIWDDTMYAIYGVNRDVFGGSYGAWERGLHPEDKNRARDAIMLAVQKNSLFDAQFRIVTPEGEIRYVVAHGKNLCDAAGKPIKMIGVNKDISASILAAKENERLNEQLMQLQKMESIGQLAGGVAHDFNNILNGILGHAALLKKKLSADPKLMRHLDTVVEAAERGAQLTKNILGFARKGQYDLKIIDLNETVHHVVDVFYSTLMEDGKKIEIKLHLADEPPLIEADTTQITQALLNLSINARDAMAAGGQITVSTQYCILNDNEAREHLIAAGRYVVLSFEDTGTGIPKEIQQKVFEPFFTTKEKGKGTGLGLSMLYGIMKNHKGCVVLDSSFSKGAKFKLYFPSSINLQKQESKISAIKDSALVASYSNLYGKHIVLVDDEIVALSFLQELFDQHQLLTTIAKDGEEALAHLKASAMPVDLFVLDIIMPKMNGIELYKQLRQQGYLQPVLFASGYTESPELSTILQEDAKVHLLQKPLKSEVLLKEILVLLA